jgi:hypothetical protein
MTRQILDPVETADHRQALRSLRQLSKRQMRAYCPQGTSDVTDVGLAFSLEGSPSASLECARPPDLLERVQEASVLWTACPGSSPRASCPGSVLGCAALYADIKGGLPVKMIHASRRPWVPPVASSLSLRRSLWRRQRSTMSRCPRPLLPVRKLSIALSSRSPSNKIDGRTG